MKRLIIRDKGKILQIFEAKSTKITCPENGATHHELRYRVRFGFDQDDREGFACEWSAPYAGLESVLGCCDVDGVLFKDAGESGKERLKAFKRQYNTYFWRRNDGTYFHQMR
jgi:hypothetical protein